MTGKECIAYWKRICEIYDDNRLNGDNRPDTAMNKMIAEIGSGNVFEVFSTVAKIKENDGRIYGKNRVMMNSTPFNEEALADRHWGSDKYGCSLLDHIHTTHIDNLISALRGERR